MIYFFNQNGKITHEVVICPPKKKQNCCYSNDLQNLIFFKEIADSDFQNNIFKIFLINRSLGSDLVLIFFYYLFAVI